MKGVDTIIAAILIILISVIGITIVLESSKPSVDRLQEISLFEESKKILTQIDNAVRDVAQEGEGSTRVLHLSISGGNYVIDTDKETVIFSMDSTSQVVGIGVSKSEGDINMFGELNRVYLNITYPSINITEGGSFGKGYHSLIIRNNGYDFVNEKQLISITLIAPVLPPTAFVNQYNQYGPPYILKGNVFSGNYIDLNVLGEGLTYNILEAIKGETNFYYQQSQTENITGANTTSADNTFSIDNFNYNVTSTSGRTGGTFTDQYNQSQTTNITGNASTTDQATIDSYLNVKGDGLTWDVSKAVGGQSTIAFDRASSMMRSTTASSISWSHTTGTGSNRLLLVTVGVHVATGTPTTVTGVTYGGFAMTQVTTALYSATTPRVRTYVFQLINPASGTNTITVNFAAATLSVAGAVTYSGVDQTDPIQTTSTSTGSGTAPSASVTVTGSGRLLFGHLGGHRATNAWTITEGAGQTNRWSQISQLYKGRGSDKSVTAGSQSMSWTLNRIANYVVSAIVINPATFYRVEVRHNSSDIEYSGNLNDINVSLNFTSSIPDYYYLRIYNWFNGVWDQLPCQSSLIFANVPYNWWCNITDNPSYYISPDNKVMIGMSSATNTVQGTLKENYIQYYISYTRNPSYANISVEHNSSTVSENPPSITKINVTSLLKTNITGGITFNLYIYNFNTPGWEQCSQKSVGTGYTRMECDITTNPSYYISNNRIRVRLNSSGDTTAHQLMEDYLVYRIMINPDYTLDVWHNSSQIADGDINFINATVNFTTNESDDYSLQMYDWLNAQWTDCNSDSVSADTPTRWWCNMTSNPMNYNSSDRRVRIRLNSTADSDAGLLREDYVQYFIGYAQ